MSNRYLSVPVFQSSNYIIPIWDTKIRYIESDSGEVIKHPDHYNSLILSKAIYDLVDKKLLTGIPLEIFDTDTRYEVGESVYYEVSHRYLKESVVASIEKGRHTLRIELGKDIESCYRSQVSVTISDNVLYALTIYQPKYILADGKAIEYDHQMYKKVS